MRLYQCKGDWALITGASAGIGRELALQLAAAGLNLVLVARREALLGELAAELTRRHGARVLAVPLDLTQPAAIGDLAARMAAAGVRIRMLCNNAAIGRWGPFEAAPGDAYAAMVRLNVEVPVALCQRFLADLTAHPTSAILNVSSPAALQPVPYMAVYAATKAFLHSFSQALYGELEPRGVLVQAFLPPPTATEFDRLAGAYESALTSRADPAHVVRDCLAHLGRATPVARGARGTRRQQWFAALAPSRMVIATVAKMFRPPPAR